MVNPLRIFDVSGFYNPVTFFYFFLRVLLRILLRRKNRDKIARACFPVGKEFMITLIITKGRGK